MFRTIIKRFEGLLHHRCQSQKEWQYIHSYILNIILSFQQLRYWKVKRLLFSWVIFIRKLHWKCNVTQQSVANNCMSEVNFSYSHDAGRKRLGVVSHDFKLVVLAFTPTIAYSWKISGIIQVKCSFWTKHRLSHSIRMSWSWVQKKTSAGVVVCNCQMCMLEKYSKLIPRRFQASETLITIIEVILNCCIMIFSFSFWNLVSYRCKNNCFHFAYLMKISALSAACT